MFTKMDMKENPMSSLATFTGEFSLSLVDCKVQDSTCAYYSQPFSAFSSEYKVHDRHFFLGLSAFTNDLLSSILTLPFV
jgi:hypothetical protein